MKTSLILSLALCSCTIKPTAKLADGTLITLGGSLGTKSKYEKATARYNSLTLDYESLDKDETAIPKTYISAPVIQTGIKQAASVGKFLSR